MMGKSFLKGTDAVVLVVDLTSKHSMSGIDVMYERIRSLAQFGNDDFPCCLVGNKLDIAEKEEGKEREISAEDLRTWCANRRPGASESDSTDSIITFFETSAKAR